MCDFNVEDAESFLSKFLHEYKDQKICLKSLQNQLCFAFIFLLLVQYPFRKRLQFLQVYLIITN